MTAKWAHFRISPELYERAQAAAAADRRSLSNWFALTIERRLDEIASGQEPARPVP